MRLNVRLFATLRLSKSSDAITIEVPDGATAAEVLETIAREHEDLSRWIPSCRIAVGVDFAQPETVLKEGDDLALIPPVQGGAGDAETPVRTVVLTNKPLDDLAGTLLGGAPSRPEAGGGAVVEFWGIVRGREDGEPIDGIEYEAYPEMAEHQIHRVLDDLEGRLPLLRTLVLHRIGWVPVGEPSLYVRIESSHRREAFVACQSFIDQLKRDVPIWKHVRPTTGSS